MGFAFFLVTLAPVLGFVDYGYMQFSFVVDRFQDLAGIGVMAVLVGSAVRGENVLRAPFRMAARGVFIVVIVLLGALSWRQSGVYRDEGTFFSHIVATRRLAMPTSISVVRSSMRIAWSKA